MAVLFSVMGTDTAYAVGEGNLDGGAASVSA